MGNPSFTPKLEAFRPSANDNDSRRPHADCFCLLRSLFHPRTWLRPGLKEHRCHHLNHTLHASINANQSRAEVAKMQEVPEGVTRIALRLESECSCPAIQTRQVSITPYLIRSSRRRRQC